MTDLFNRISENKQNAILAAALSEFARYGYEGANINHIAAKAHVSVGSLYKYFENKLDLFLYVMRCGAADIQNALDDIMREDEDILVKVERLLRFMQKYARANADMLRMYNQMTVQADHKLVESAVLDMEMATAKLYTTLIVKAQKEGEAREDFDPKLFAFFLDNLFMTFHFSYACDYYVERFKAYAGADIFSRDDFVVEQMLAFIKAAFAFEHKPI